MSKPKIRFKGFTDDWEQHKLGDIGYAKSGVGFPDSEQGGQKGIPFFKVSDMNTNGNENELVVANNYVTDEQIARKHWNVIYDVPAIFFAKVGAAVMLNRKRLVRFPFLLDNNTMAYVFEKKVWNCDFGKTLFETIDLTKLTQVGALPSYNSSDIESIQILIPKFEEQTKIGQYFSQLDNLITLHQRKYDKLVNIKKSMLEKMFPQNGVSVPEIRFKGFTDDWEQRKLGDIASSFEYGLNSAAKEFDGVNKYIRITDIDDNTHEFLKDNLTSPDIDLIDAENYKLAEGDILFARTGASVGKSYIYKDSDGLVYYAGFLIRARIKEKYNAEFVFQNTLTDKYNKYITVTSQRSGQPGVNAQEYSEFKIQIPNKKEQTKIGQYFSQLDNLITLHQCKIEKLKNIKKSCLEKMLV